MEHELSWLRPLCFFTILILMALWEIKAPKKKLTLNKSMRWANNFALVFSNSFLLAWILPILAIDSALIAESKGLGLFHFSLFQALPFPLIFILSLLILDGLIYWQHRIFHRVPILWRLHRLHHADQDIDLSTGARFHFIEILLSMLIKMAAILLLGVPWQAVLTFEIILNACAMFNHSNVRLSQKWDARIRPFFVTPDMHRVHHSSLAPEMHHNFGFSLSIWDRIFKSYQDQPKLGHDAMQIGLPNFRSIKEQKFFSMLTQPFRS